MKSPWKPSSPYFGPKRSSKLKVTHVSLRKPRKHKSRFVSPAMKRIEEQLKKENIARAVGATNQASVPRQAEQSSLEIRNMSRLKSSTMSDHLGPAARNVSKSNYSLAASKNVTQVAPKVGNHSKSSAIINVPSGKVDKATNSRPTHKSNGMPRPLELSRQPRMKQGSVHAPNPMKRSYSQANHLKAMPGLVHNKKDRSNLDHGAAMGMQNECVHGGTKVGNMRCEPLQEPERPDERMQIGHGLGGTNKNMRCELSPERKISSEGMQSEGGIGGTNDINMRCESSPELDIGRNISRNRKRRKYIETNYEVDDSSDQGHQNDDGSTKLPSHCANLMDCHAKVTSFVSDCVAQHCCSMPIDEPAWRGILKIGNKEYIPLEAHLSTKSGEKVWKLSKSLGKMVAMTKVCRLDVWPKRWETSGPTSDNIGLYFFSYKMSPDDKYMDQLIKEAMENDLALQATIDEAELLIFPSSLLPEKYQKFQSKHYLWGVFRPRVVQAKHGDESRHVENPTEETTAAVANATTGPPAEATAVTTDAGVAPAEAPVMPTTVPSNGRIDLSMGAPPGGVVGFVVRKTARVEQLIQEIEREGALIVAMQGEMIAGDGSLGSLHGDRNAVSRNSA